MARARRRTQRKETGVKGARILVVEARYYDDIADMLLRGTKRVLRDAQAEFDIVTVPGALEIPGAIIIALDAAAGAERPYEGVVALGCVIRGETSHYDLITNHVARGLMELSISGVPLGFGVLTVENEEQAKVRADRKQKNKGAEVVAAVLRMVGLSYRFNKMDDIEE
jgi:6,7-dimethyl-8-ribityllumazine synthase